MKAKKVLVISHLYPYPGDSLNGIFVRNQTKELVRNGIEVLVISPKILFKEKVSKEEKGLINVLYPNYLSLGKYFGIFTDITSHLAISRVLRKTDFKPDTILAHTALPDGGAAKLLSRKLNIPYFLYIHGADVQRKIYFNRFFEAKIIGILKGATKVFTNSSKISNILKELSIESLIIPMGVSNDCPKRLRKSRDLIRIISVCNLKEEKGLQHAIKAFKGIKNNNLSYEIIGSGPYADNLKRLAQDDRRIIFLGSVSNDKVKEKLADSDIFLLPSYNEAFGVSYLEAMCAGIPVIGCRGEGIEDILSKGNCGILTRPKDVKSIQDALTKLIDNEEMRLGMGDVGRMIVSKNYTWDKVGKEMAKELL